MYSLFGSGWNRIEESNPGIQSIENITVGSTNDDNASMITTTDYQYPSDDFEYRLPPSYDYLYDANKTDTINNSMHNDWSIFSNSRNTIGYRGSSKLVPQSTDLTRIGPINPFSIVQTRMRSPPALFPIPSDLPTSSTTITRSSITSKRLTKKTRKSVMSTKKKASITRRGTKQTSRTTTVESKRFRSEALKRIRTTPARLPSRATRMRKSTRTKTPSVRGKRFRQLRRTRTTSRSRPSNRRRFRNLRRTRPTLRRTPLAKPRYRKVTLRPRVAAPSIFEYDFIYF